MNRKRSLVNFWLAFVVFIFMLAIYYTIRSAWGQEPATNSGQNPLAMDRPNVPENYSEVKQMVLDIRYATKNNFTNEQIYPCGRCFLRKEAKIALAKAEKELNGKGYKLVLFDCYRPAPAQQKLWKIVPNPDYVTPPEKGSMHNRGLAVDLSLVDMQGKPIDMGTPYDYFGEEAHTDYKAHSENVLQNRALLTGTMEKFGFKGIRTEWWHFSLANISSPIASWEWSCD